MGTPYSLLPWCYARGFAQWLVLAGLGNQDRTKQRFDRDEDGHLWNPDWATDTSGINVRLAPKTSS
ncbi:unnamed protein product [Penicillium pancosmium]